MTGLLQDLRFALFDIVGVVSDSRNYNFEGPGMMVLRRPEMTLPEAFLRYSVSGFGDRAIAMQTWVPPVSLVNNVRRILWTLDHDVVLVAPDVGGARGFSLDDLMPGLVYGKPRFSAFAFGACASLGFALAVVGLFSVMTYIASLQTHDVGVGMALGAPRGAILQLMLKTGLVLIVTGLAIGLLASIGLTRFLSSQLRGISPTDPLTFILLVPICPLFARPARHARGPDGHTQKRIGALLSCRERVPGGEHR